MSVTKIPVDGLSGGEGILSAAYAGVLETNATFVDQAIFGPSVDGQAWNGKWSVASLYSSLMLVTIEDAGSDTQVNIWDLTEQSGGAPSTTPLGTVTLSGDATPTSVAACMGYIIVGSEDGISIIDPHSGSWAERTTGWPRSLSTSTTPALASNDVQGVAATSLQQQPIYDPRTGGPMPTFGVKYVSGTAKANSIIKDDGNVWDIAGDGSSQADYGIAFVGSRLITAYSDTQLRLTEDPSLITGDQSVNPPYFWLSPSMNGYNLAALPDTAASAGGLTALGAGEGLGLNFGVDAVGNNATNGQYTLNAGITRAYNTGYYAYDIRGIWLANSKTVDRSWKANTLTENGTVTEAAVETSAELMGYSGWTSSNYLRRADDADWNSIGTGSAYLSAWFNVTNNTGTCAIAGFGGGTGTRFFLRCESSGNILFMDDGATANTQTESTPMDDGVWHKADFVRVSSTERYMYIDGVQIGATTTDAGSLTGTVQFDIGQENGTSISNNGSATYSLVKFSTTAPSATQIRQMYDAEKGLFVASAECLLQSGSTDAILDVDVDPLSGKVLVTQTDAITIFDGLVVDSKPTVNSGNSEKGKLWGALRAEQNSANAYVTAPATDQRQVNEMVRGLASDLPAGVDLGKAKAWIQLNMQGPTIVGSYNVKSVTDNGTGNFSFNFAIPFKNGSYVCSALAAAVSGPTENIYFADTSLEGDACTLINRNDAGTFKDSALFTAVWFGELENE